MGRGAKRKKKPIIAKRQHATAKRPTPPRVEDRGDIPPVIIINSVNNARPLILSGMVGDNNSGPMKKKTNRRIEKKNDKNTLKCRPLKSKFYFRRTAPARVDFFGSTIGNRLFRKYSHFPNVLRSRMFQTDY